MIVDVAVWQIEVGSKECVGWQILWERGQTRPRRLLPPSMTTTLTTAVATKPHAERSTFDRSRSRSPKEDGCLEGDCCEGRDREGDDDRRGRGDREICISNADKGLCDGKEHDSTSRDVSGEPKSSPPGCCAFLAVNPSTTHSAAAADDRTTSSFPSTYLYHCGALPR